MAIYTNHTRFSAVATVHVTAVSETKGALTVLRDGVLVDKLDADKGHHDFVVEPGRTLDLSEGTQALLFAIRTCP